MWVLRKTYRFEASHKLPHHDGKCRNLHGHSWKATVILVGDSLNFSGPKEDMLVDYGTIDEFMNPVVEKYLDHQHLNDSLDMESPTSERISCWLFNYLRATEIGSWLHSVEICETENTSCLYMVKPI